MYILKSRQVDDAALAELEKGADMTHQDGLLRIVQGLRRVDTGTYALRIRLAENSGSAPSTSTPWRSSARFTG
jgi:hypothetical protein